MTAPPVRVLSIAGSDSGGGAGIQADIKTITMMGGYAMTAITAVTAQNAQGVSAITAMSAEMVRAQIDAVTSDFGIDAIKIGMLGSAQIADMVAAFLEGLSDNIPIVLDPVMVATSGAALADQATIKCFTRLMRCSTVVTPNRMELEALGGRAAILGSGAALLEKGGHDGADNSSEPITDRLIAADGSEQAVWSASRIATPHSHGTGCTLSSAMATALGQGAGLIQAVERARLFVRLALHDAPQLVADNGPMGHGCVRVDATQPGLLLNQVTLGCDDYAASVAFYARLGLTQIVDSAPKYARFETACGSSVSLHHSDIAPGDALVYFECADLDAVCADLSAQGVHFDQLPTDQRWGWREARLRDPFGNRLCLYFGGENRRYPPWRMGNDRQD